MTVTVQEQEVEPVQEFRVKIRDAKQFKQILGALSVFSDDLQLTVNSDGLHARQMDPSHVAMFQFDYPKSAMYEYRPPLEGEAQVEFNLTEVLKLFRNVHTEDYLELSWSSDKGVLDIRFVGVRDRTFHHMTLKPEAWEEAPIPKINLDAKVKMAMAGFKEALADLELVADNTRISVDSDRIVFSAKGDIDGLESPFNRDSEHVLRIEALEPVEASYSLDYLSRIVKGLSKVSDVVDLGLSTNMPLKLSACLVEVGLEFWLAPRIEA